MSGIEWYWKERQKDLNAKYKIILFFPFQSLFFVFKEYIFVFYQSSIGTTSISICNDAVIGPVINFFEENNKQNVLIIIKIILLIIWIIFTHKR